MADDATGYTVLEERLRTDLRRAMRNQDRNSVAALRIAVAAIDNAGSVGIPMENRSPVVEGASDVPRREFSEEEVIGIVRREADDLLAGISSAESHGSTERAEELRAQYAVLAAYIEA